MLKFWSQLLWNKLKKKKRQTHHTPFSFLELLYSTPWGPILCAKQMRLKGKSSRLSVLQKRRSSMGQLDYIILLSSLGYCWSLLLRKTFLEKQLLIFLHQPLIPLTFLYQLIFVRHKQSARTFYENPLLCLLTVFILFGMFFSKK